MDPSTITALEAVGKAGMVPLVMVALYFVWQALNERIKASEKASAEREAAWTKEREALGARIGALEDQYRGHLTETVVHVTEVLAGTSSAWRIFVEEWKKRPCVVGTEMECTIEEAMKGILKK